MKRIALCLDGTWNDNKAGFVQTNVAKLQPLIAKVDANGVRQISHYIPGIANTPGETAQFLKGAVGFGIGDRIRDAYEKLVADYQPGDEIYLFGFSRGAFEARSLGTLITLFGVAKSVANFPFEEAWSLYRTRARRRGEDALDEVRAAAHYPVRIKCMGVWDTVGNIGNPFSSSGPIGRMFKFHDTRLSDSIDVGLHALSIDEIRGPFRPALWALPKGQALPERQHIEQVWFAGTHCNVGGGFRETGLSDIALRWMVERTAATTGLAFDTPELIRSTRPDPLAPQHMSATGSIFRWSRFVPFVRLVRQAIDGISPLRRALLGTWRTSKLRGGRTSVNESIHPSVLQRFGQKVIELIEGRSHMIVYRPSNLAPAMPEPQAPVAQEAPAKPRRVKVFTVHGTFAHAADWDDWDKDDNDCKKTEHWQFVNRLAQHLRSHGVTLDELDHTQYDWSGGNSHPERLTAAIGLKKLIETDLGKTYAEHGEDYYDRVYIVGHSHGGTISRLAMNLWDKEPDYYDPPDKNEPAHDDECPTCLRTRNGLVGRNTVRRPDGVITFGSPFVTFEKRRGGLLTARIAVWVYRILAVLPLAGLVYFLWSDDTIKDVTGQMREEASFLRTALILGTPLLVFWLAGVHWTARLQAWAERRFGKGSSALVSASSALLLFKYLLLVLLAVYYIAYATVGLERIGSWLPFLKPIGEWFTILTPLILLWLLVVTLPGRFLGWMRNKVAGLREQLPKKFDPPEDKPAAYLNYHTPGDEAGAHLRAFSALTWTVQTLALAAACVLAAGIILSFVIGVEAINHSVFNSSVLARFGVSAWNSEYQAQFVRLMDWLTFLPAAVWSWIFGLTTTKLNLGDLANAREVAWYIPLALLAAIVTLFLLLMPLVLVLLGIAYAVSIRLRSSGLVFGGESFAWTMASRIGVKRRANDNSLLRLLFITPEAWRRQEIAHCYYYKSDRVIRDMASYMADWSRHAPWRFLSVGEWTADAARWAIVLLFVLSIFAVSVPFATSFAGMRGVSATQVASQADVICKEEAHRVEVEYQDTLQLLSCDKDRFDRRAAPVAQNQWKSEVTGKFGAEWSDWKLARPESPVTMIQGCSFSYIARATPCRLRDGPGSPAASAPAVTPPPDGAQPQRR